ncbi:calcium-binding EGF-like domain-containing protein [Sorangium sp. So ce1014]|uniref:calcium-binding EGF-like domain-containing protein n=1 Tax=Sorangium sp. So ce1014 TaxID=3133326 RepID=UPI003F61C307
MLLGGAACGGDGEPPAASGAGGAGAGGTGAGGGSTSAGGAGAGGEGGTGAGGEGGTGAGGEGGTGAGGEGGTGAGGEGGCAPTPITTVACADLTDMTGQWSAFAEDGATTSITQPDGGVNGTFVQADTQAAFAFHLRFEPEFPVDASAATSLQLAVRANNTSGYGWQINSPVLVVEDQDGAQRIYTPGSVLLPVDGIAWRLLSVPVAGGDGWTVEGPAIDMARVSAIEIRTDTWDAGFSLSVDALSFKQEGESCAVSCPSGCSGRGACEPLSLGCSCEIGATGPDCGECAEGFVEKDGACALQDDGVHAEWPNPTSRANSDPWIAAHHDEIEVLRPRLLVLHFPNPSDPATSTIVSDVVAGFSDGSRFHAYRDAEAAPQLVYQIDKVVDLRDGVNGRPPAPPDYVYENSTLYPRKSTPDGLVLDYGAFFSEEFAELYGYSDPDEPGQFLDLCALLDRGLVHEVWMVGSGDVPDAPAFEVLENKQRYTASGTRIAGAFERCAGNGCFEPDVPFCGRSVRIGFVNYTRGPGCYMHSQGHGLESAAAHGVAPGLSEWFAPFAAFDLDRKYGLPFSSLYGLDCATPPCVELPVPTKAVFTAGDQTFEVEPYDAVCGNVHFPPNGRSHYDYAPSGEVMSSCAAFGENGLACGVDETEAVTKETWAAYEALHGDCGGGFLTWWYQSMPAFGAAKTFADGRRMKSVWPYLFY